jgi:tricorn protease
MSGVYGPEGEWLIEQIGVLPDQVVDNLPHATFNGEDAQLDAAIGYLLRRIEEDPREVPPPPAHPNRAFRYP